MSKRNFILLIIILAIVVVGVFGFLYLQQPTGTLGVDTGGTNFGSQFNPFGNNNKPVTPAVTPPVDVSGYEPTPTNPDLLVKLRKISSMPIAGFTVFSKERLKDVPVVTPNNTTPPSLPLSGEGANPVPPAKGGAGGLKKTLVKPIAPPTEFMPALRYVERATGNIYQTFADRILEQKFSITIIPKIYEVFFGNNGGSVIMRYLKGDAKTIATFVGNLPKEILGADTTSSNEVKGTFLPDDIKDVSLSSDAGSLFYLFNSGDNMIGTTLNFATNKKVQVFSSAFTEWLSWWPNSKMITFTTKPASSVQGYMYMMDPTNKNLTKVLGGINGLTTLTSPSGKLVLYSDNNLFLNVYHTDTKTTDPLGVKTLPEKCVWNKTSDTAYCGVPKNINAGSYPDTWYQGEVSFSDQIWKIDIKTGNATIIADPVTVQGGQDTDSIKLALDDGENYLFFVNKKDSFLWELGLK
ncbi:MAG: hypothetical protein WC793_01880 [Candidatus Paceibacterota bacterium]|jgi:hypothetical protein